MQLSPVQIGQKLKQIHSEYAPVPEDKLGEAYMKKYGPVVLPDNQQVSQPGAEINSNMSNSGESIISKILGGVTRITQAFGNKNPIEKFSGGVNYGTDFAAKVGTPVNLPPGEWEVVEANANGGMNRGYGNSVLVKNKQTGEKLRFSHLSQVGVRPGQTLKGGQIGATGATGNVTGPHLDLEYYNQQGRLADVLRSSYKTNL